MERLEKRIGVYCSRIIVNCPQCKNICVCSVFAVVPTVWHFHCHNCQASFQMEVAFKKEEKECMSK